MKLNPSTLTKFVDALPLPSVIKPIYKNDCETYYEVTMTEFRQKLHRQLNPTTLWGYNGTYPGPTFEVQKNESIKVKWINNLPENHLLPVDHTIHGACATPEVRTVVHLHGGRTPADSDGYPEAWFTNNFEKVGPIFEQEVYTYPNIQDAATLWYHDHALGITRLNVYAGLSGFYLLRDRCEQSLNLPKGNYEIPLVIQDRCFNTDGSLLYPRHANDCCTPSNPNDCCTENDLDCTNPCCPIDEASVVPEFFGDILLVNGKIWPYLNVEPRKYRFRLLNGSNARFYNLKFNNNLEFTQIGTDQGLLEHPVELSSLLLGPGERADVVVDFSNFKNQDLVLENSANAPFPNGTDPDTNTGVIMKFKVQNCLTSPDRSKVPYNLRELCKLPRATRTRTLRLVESTDECDRIMLLLDNKEWVHRISEIPRLGDVEIWELVNETPDTHPIHLHLVEFKILNNETFTFDTNGNVVPSGILNLPTENERGFKDTVKVPPNTITRIITRFAPFTGRYVWHCHILEHEDHEMMRPYEILPKRYLCCNTKESICGPSEECNCKKCKYNRIIADVELVLNSEESTQAEVDEAVELLENTMEEFNRSIELLGKKELEDTINEAKNILNNVQIGLKSRQYPQDSVDTLNKFINNAEIILNESQISQTKIDETCILLKMALEDFNKSMVIVNKDDLQSIINKAKNILQNL
jgi:spore coat protein A, manganese oxidase